jgi:dTDP-4-dehydrorhamnose reductase
MATILVTGAKGQLGSELQELSVRYPFHQFLFTDREELMIQEEASVLQYFEEHQIDFCVNCAAYTAVDRAESEPALAHLINGTATGILARACRTYGASMIHISTDYVFNGKAKEPYAENAPTDPISVYGASKLAGEQMLFSELPSAILIRTSWVYSVYGGNFVKTMLRLMAERNELKVVSDQWGAPTYAADLAKVVMDIIDGVSEKKLDWVPGIYHYSNEGAITWYHFAEAIAQIAKASCTVLPITTAEYPTAAQRPAYSVFQKDKIKTTFGIYIPHWRSSLEACILKISKDLAAQTH